MTDLKRTHELLTLLKREQAYLNKRLDVIKQSIAQEEARIRSAMESLGVDLMRIDDRTYYLSEEAVYQVEDWDALYHWIVANQAPMILHRRVSKRALDELMDAGDLPEGIKPVTIKTLKSRTTR